MTSLAYIRGPRINPKKPKKKKTLEFFWKRRKTLTRGHAFNPDQKGKGRDKIGTTM
jgi:hypothetical protein